MRRLLFLTLWVLSASHVLAADPAPFHAYQQIRFSSLDQTLLDGFLFRPDVQDARPAVVMMHGCGGLVSPRGVMNAREADYAARLTKVGYVVLVIDSFTARGVRNMCSPTNLQEAVVQARPKDAYGALLFLQAQPYVRPNRIALIGWSQGGGAVLRTIRVNDNQGRPADLPQGDFRAAIAFYPSSCNDHSLKAGWETTIPLLVLTGELDVWTPFEPCKAFVDHAAERGSPVELHAYAGAYHDFDYPNLRLHEEPGYRTSSGVIPIVGMDPAAREDALTRVPAFLARYLLE